MGFVGCTPNSCEPGTNKGYIDEEELPKEYAAHQGKNYIIAIGIDEYASSASRFGNLQSCKNDCIELIKVLKEKYAYNVYGEPLYNEKADVAAITKVFADFKKSPVAKDKEASLIIYFSGHGHLFKTPNDVPKACWVPHNYVDNNDESDFYTIEMLFRILNYVTMRHIVIISDCCFAGQMMEEPTFFSFTAESKEDKSIEGSDSRWGIASSLANKMAQGGRQGEMSLFTGVLVDKLKENENKELLLSELMAGIEKHYLQNKLDRYRFYPGRLNIIKENLGQPVFRAAPSLLEEKKKLRYLPRMLATLNYTEEIKRLTVKNKPVAPLVLLSGDEHAGLRYMAQLVCKNAKFPAFGQVRMPATIPASSSGVQQVVDFFNNAIVGLDARKVEELCEKLGRRLAGNHIVLEASFYTGELEMPMSTEIKKVFLKELGSVISMLPEDTAHHLIIFIFDYTEYSAPEINELKVLHPKLLILHHLAPLDEDHLDNWYGNVTITMTEDEQQELIALFKTSVFDKFEEIATPQGSPPGAVIRKICECAACENLAHQLLDN